MRKKILKRLRFDNNTIKQVIALVKYHDFHIQTKVTENSIKEVLCEIGEDLFEKLLIVQEADARGQNPKKLEGKLKDLEKRRAIYKDIVAKGDCYSIKDLAIDGKEIVSLGIKPGKEIGELLDMALKHVMKYPNRNNKEYLLELIRQHKKNQ